MLLLAYVYSVTGYQEFDWLANVASDAVAQKKIWSSVFGQMKRQTNETLSFPLPHRTARVSD